MQGNQLMKKTPKVTISTDHATSTTPYPMIAWSKWHNPFSGKNSDEIDLSHIEEENVYKDPYEQSNVPHPENHTGPAIMTPMGVVPITEYTDIEKIFKFWNGHTNFDIDEDVFVIIEETAGVESFDVFSRYRFRIAIGQLFKDRDVMNAVLNNVKKHLTKPATTG